MRIEHDIDAVLLGLVDMAQRIQELVGLRDRLAVVAAAQSVGHAPYEQRKAFQVGRLLQQRDHARFLVRLDHDQGEARLQDQCQIVQVVHGAVQFTAPV